MARLNKTTKYAILWLNSQGFDNGKISNELGVSDQQIANTLKNTDSDHTKSENPNAIPTTSGPVNMTSKNFMIRQTANKVNNVAIMTKEASTMNDDFKKSNQPNSKNNLSNHIHKIS